MRLLLAEDERELSKALIAILEHSHYSVDAVYDGEEALLYAESNAYDGLILDIMMPKKDGISVLKDLRGMGNTVPVLLLTAKGELEDRIQGLDAGADDYLSKPFATGELLARLRAMLRRRSEYLPDDLAFGNMRLSRVDFTLATEAEATRLSSKEFQMMEMLMENPNRLISTERFLEKIWGYDADVENATVWVNISNLRKKLAGISANVRIQATRGLGYTLEEEA